MQNTRLTITILLISSIILLILIGGFLLTLMRPSQKTESKLDSQGKIDRTINSDKNNKEKTTNRVENEESGPADIRQDSLEDQKRNNPDIYIYNKVPFENQYFRIEGIGRAEGNPDFSFTVSIKGPDKALSQTKLNEWFVELGLTPGQIAGLLIEYR